MAGFTDRGDFYWTLRSTLITRPEHFETFHQVFSLFWRAPDYIEKMMEIMLPVLQTMTSDRGAPKPAQRRALEALAAPEEGASSARKERQALELDASLSWSSVEVFRKKDFEQMSAAELLAASTAIQQLVLPAQPLRSRRLVPSARGSSPDLRAMLRRSMRRGGEVDRLITRSQGERAPSLVVLCDVSGSMSVYSRMMMHFAHALTWVPNAGWSRVHAFTFGTHLTNITRDLSKKDVDQAMSAVGDEVTDWEGGTRIGAALRAFNLDWSRRVLGQGAVVLLITDGLERGALDELATEAERLALSCRKLIWLNPLLRFDGFEPKAGGIRVLLRHVDSFHACHSLDSLSDLVSALTRSVRA